MQGSQPRRPRSQARGQAFNNIYTNFSKTNIVLMPEYLKIKKGFRYVNNQKFKFMLKITPLYN
jgi:hypothetical protein